MSSALEASRYRPYEVYEHDEATRRVLDSFAANCF
jgi:hypothetical protein